MFMEYVEGTVLGDFGGVLVGRRSAILLVRW